MVTTESGSAQTIADVLSRLPRHAARRQLYVPLDILRHYGVDPEDVFAMRATPALRAALAELRLRARRSLEGVVAVEIPETIQPVFAVSAAASMASRYGEARLRPVPASTSGAVATAVANLACREIIPQELGPSRSLGGGCREVSRNPVTEVGEGTLGQGALARERFRG